MITRSHLFAFPPRRRSCLLVYLCLRDLIIYNYNIKLYYYYYYIIILNIINNNYKEFLKLLSI